MKTASKIQRGISRFFPWNGRIAPKAEVRHTDGNARDGDQSEDTPLEDRLDWHRAEEGAEEEDSATKPQQRYIKVLGGDPSSVNSKKEASDLIVRLVLQQSGWPLNTEHLAQRGAKAGAETDGEWKSAYQCLLAGIRLDFQEYVNLRLSNIRRKLSDPLGPGGSGQSRGPDELVRRAKQELSQLALCRKHGYPLEMLTMLGGSEEPSDAEPESENETVPTPAHLTRQRPRDQGKGWLGLIFTGAACILFESLVNIGLLMDALAGGALAAFILAFLVSIINVGGFGMCVGLLLAKLHQSFGRTRKWIYQTVGAFWVIIAITFNLVAGRHREAYARIVEYIRDNPTAAIPSPRSMLTDVTFNPLTWEFQALIFALLGIFLCAIGFAKGFTFYRDKIANPAADTQRHQHEENPDRDKHGTVDEEEDKSVLSPQRRLFSAFASLPHRYQDKLTGELRKEVANWYRALDQECRNLTTLLETLTEEQTWQACIDIVEQTFIAAHNNNYPDKIDLQRVKAHRLEKYSEPPTVTAYDQRVVDEATALLSRWRESGQAEFDNRLAAAQQEVTTIWKNYEPLVLGKPIHHPPNGETTPSGRIPG